MPELAAPNGPGVLRWQYLPKDERYLKRKSQRNGWPIRSNLPKEWVRSERLSNLLLVSAHVGTFINIRLTAVIAPDLERTIERRNRREGVCYAERDSMFKEKILPHMEEVVLAEHHPIVMDILPGSCGGFHRFSSTSSGSGCRNHGRSRLPDTSCHLGCCNWGRSRLFSTGSHVRCGNRDGSGFETTRDLCRGPAERRVSAQTLPRDVQKGLGKSRRNSRIRLTLLR